MVGGQKLAQDCTVNIVCRKGKSVPYERNGGSGGWLGRVRRSVDVAVVTPGG